MMKHLFWILILILLTLNLSCISGPSENPDGKYGKPVQKENSMELQDLMPKQGQYLQRNIVIHGKISQIDTLAGAWFVIESGTDNIKCTIKDGFGLPQSLVGKEVYAEGILTIVQVSSEKGRQPGAEYTFGADPSSSSYQDELRLEVRGVEIVMQD